MSHQQVLNDVTDSQNNEIIDNVQNEPTIETKKKKRKSRKAKRYLCPVCNKMKAKLTQHIKNTHAMDKNLAGEVANKVMTKNKALK